MAVASNAVVPSSQQPIADKSGRITAPWLRFVNLLVGSNPAPIVALAPPVGPSAFFYTASASGTLFIFGGTALVIALGRSGVAIPCDSNTIPVANGDVVEIVYSTAPTVNFVPS